MERYTINYDNKVIEFELKRKNVKNINLRIKRDASIMVSVNKDVPIEYIQEFIKSKAPWIIKHVKHFEKVQSEKIINKEYVSGETFKYLGRQYRLKVEETNGKEEVKYYQGYIYLLVKDKNNYSRKEKLLNDWFRNRAEKKFNESLDRVYPIVEKYGIVKPHISIRTMKARWGSCIRGKDTIVLNSKLITAPKLCIDYVVLHELIHFKYRYHNDDFYNFLTALMPDWRQRKVILDEEVVKEL